MPIQLKVVNKKTLQEMNQNLVKLNSLYNECIQAESAGVPGLDVVKVQCQDLAERIAKFKQVYFSTDI